MSKKLLFLLLFSVYAYPNSEKIMQLEVEIYIEEKPYRFLFDTGLTHSIIDENVVKKLKLTKTKVFFDKKNHIPSLVFFEHNYFFFKKIGGFYSNIDIKFTTNTSNNLQKITSSFFLSKSLDDDLKLSEQKKISGIIGWDVIKKFNWKIDLKKGIAIPCKKEKNNEPITKYKMMLKLYKKNNLPYTSVIINKTYNFNLLFDTGAQVFLTIDKNIFQTNTKDSYSNTLYGKCKGKYVEVKDINVNNLSFKANSIPIGVFSELNTHKNLLGLEFFLSFSKLYIDNCENKVFLY